MGKIKSTIGYMPVVESISRKFVPRRETCGHRTAGIKSFSPLSYMGGGVRQSYAAGYGNYKVNYLFMRKHARSTGFSADERAQQARFKNASGCTATIMHSLAQITSVQTLWNAAREDLSKTISGVSAYGYDMRGWVFAVTYARLADGATVEQASTFPTQFDA